MQSECREEAAAGAGCLPSFPMACMAHIRHTCGTVGQVHYSTRPVAAHGLILFNTNHLTNLSSFLPCLLVLGRSGSSGVAGVQITMHQHTLPSIHPDRMVYIQKAGYSPTNRDFRSPYLHRKNNDSWDGGIRSDHTETSLSPPHSLHVCVQVENTLNYRR